MAFCSTNMLSSSNEVIEITSESDGENASPKSRKKMRLGMSMSTRSNDKPDHLFSKWGIKKSDEDMTAIGSLNLSDSEKKELGLIKSFRTKLRFFRLAGYTNTECPNENQIEIETNTKLTIYLTDDDNKIQIILGQKDLYFCAAVILEDLYILVIDVNPSIANDYDQALKSLDTYSSDFKPNDITSTRMILGLSLHPSDPRSMNSLLYFLHHHFFKKKEPGQAKLCVLKRKKSEELLSRVLKPDDLALLPQLASFLKSGSDSEIVLKYQFRDQTAKAEIMKYDLECLNEGEFLNDNIIQFYLKYIEQELLIQEDRERTYIFDTFFFQSLTNRPLKKTKDGNLKAAEKRYLRVKNWTRNVDIFKKDFLIVPINKHSHWFLAIICYPYLNGPVFDEEDKESCSSKSSVCNSIKSEKVKVDVTSSNGAAENTLVEDQEKRVIQDICANEESEDLDTEEDNEFRTASTIHKNCAQMPIILLFDSLNLTPKKRVIATLKEYLYYEYKTKHSNDEAKLEIIKSMPGLCVDVPQQTNSYDCGIYLLQYVEAFFGKPIQKINSSINLSDWFDVEVINEKRQRIRNVIDFLSKKQRPEAIQSDAPAPSEPSIA